MEQAALLAFIMYFGVIAQSAVMTAKKAGIRGAVLPLLGIALLYLGASGTLFFLQHHGIILVLIAVYMLIFTVLNHRHLLQTIDERILLVYTLAFWYVYLTYLVHGPALDAVFLVPTVAVFVMALTSWVPPPFFRLGFYIWYLATSVGIFISLISHGAMSIYFDASRIADIGIVDAFFAGMVLFPLTANAIILYYILPIHDDEKPAIDRTVLERDAISRYSTDQLTRIESAFILLFMGALMGVNHLLGLADGLTLINLCIVAAPQMAAAIDGMVKKPAPPSPQ